MNPDPEFFPETKKKNEDTHLLGKASIHPSMNSKKKGMQQSRKSNSRSRYSSVL